MKPISISQENKEIYGFFIIAVTSLIKKYDTKGKENCETNPKMNDYQETLKFLNEMRIFVDEAIQDEKCVRECFAPSDQLLNRGRMSLVSLKFYQFSLQLMKFIIVACSKRKLLGKKNDFIIEGKKELYGNDELITRFLKIATTSDLKDKEKENIYDSRVLKTFHARTGGVTNSCNDANDSRHCKDGFGGESFRTNLKIKSPGVNYKEGQRNKRNGYFGKS